MNRKTIQKTDKIEQLPISILAISDKTYQIEYINKSEIPNIKNMISTKYNNENKIETYSINLSNFRNCSDNLNEFFIDKEDVLLEKCVQEYSKEIEFTSFNNGAITYTTRIYMKKIIEELINKMIKSINLSKFRLVDD